MEFVKKNIHMNKTKCKTSLQFVLDNDFNVSDTKPDIVRIIRTQGEIRLKERKLSNGKLYLDGSLCFQMLYLSDDAERPVHSIRGELPFNEVVNMEENCSSEAAQIAWELEDLTAGIINSRKVSIKALVRAKVAVEELYDEEAAIQVVSDEPLQTQYKVINLTSLAMDSRDSYRFRDQIALPSGKGDVRDLLYTEVELKNVETRLTEDKFTARGDLVVFLLYECDSEDRTVDYYETELPFSATIECSGCNEDMTPDINFAIANQNFEIRPDSDGEERIIEIEAVFDVRIKIYEEEELEILKDLYMPGKEVTPIYREAEYENLLAKNSNKVRVNERVSVSKGQPGVLQICHGSGEIRLDEIIPSEHGLEVEGIIDLHLLYISADDQQPIQALRAAIPFNQMVEVKGMEENVIYDVKPCVEQINIMMLDAEEVEVKATLVLNSIVFKKNAEAFLIDAMEAPIDLELWQEMPGMTGYLVKSGDTLWDIAKHYHTTIDCIRELNELEGDRLFEGRQLLILKDASFLT